MVHWTLAGCAPPEVVKEMFRAALPPGAALPELSEMATCCANAGLEAVPKTIRTAEIANFINELRRQMAVFILPSGGINRPLGDSFVLALSLNGN